MTEVETHHPQLAIPSPCPRAQAPCPSPWPHTHSPFLSSRSSSPGCQTCFWGDTEHCERWMGLF